MIDIRLDSSLFSGVQPCPRCADGQYERIPILDKNGHHATICPAADGAVRRHNSLRDRFISFIANGTTFVNLQREWTLPHDGDEAPSHRKRLDFYIDDNDFAEKPQGFDVTVISPHSTPYVTSSRSRAGYCLKAAEEAKRLKYDELCEDLNIEFHPMAIDIYGAVGPGFEQGVHRISDYLSSKRGTCPVSERREILMQVTSLVLQRTVVAINRRRLHFYALEC